MKEFVTAVAEAKAEGTEDEGKLTWVMAKPDPSDPTNAEKYERTECHAFQPDDGQLAFLLASNGRHVSTEERVAGLVNFFDSMCDEETSSYLSTRLLDRTDPFGLKEMQEIMEWMNEEWGARPTK